MNKSIINGSPAYRGDTFLISKIGIGAVRFGRDTDLKFYSTIPSDTELLNFLCNAKGIGINYIDTAPAYGDSEERIGRLLYGQRHDWIISTKVGEQYDKSVGSTYSYNYESITESFYNSLYKLKTDYIDIVFVHANNELNRWHSRYHDVLCALNDIKKSGWVRYIGWSVPDTPSTYISYEDAIEVSDIVMLTYNKNNTNTQNVKFCRNHNKKIIVKKPLDSGRIKAKDGYSYILNMDYTKSFQSILTGTLNIEHLKEAVRCVDEYYN